MSELLRILFNAASAWNQAGLLLGSGFIGGIGALLLGDRIYWRVAAMRVAGTLIGVREPNRNVYYPVYRFTLPDGTSCEANSDTGSSSIAGLQTGSETPLMVFAQHPEKVAVANSWAVEIIGGILLLVAVCLGYVALTHWPVTAFTWVMLTGVAAYLLIRLKNTARRAHPKVQPGPSSVVSPGDGDQRLKDAPVRSIDEALAKRDPQAERSQQKGARVWTPILWLVGIALLTAGAYLGHALWKLQNGGTRASGTVVSIESRSGSHGYTYYPVVRFTTEDGTAVVFRDRVGTNPPAYRGGESVPVLYTRGSAQSSAIIDRGVWNWLPSGGMSLFGALLLALAWRARRGSLGPQSRRLAMP